MKKVDAILTADWHLRDTIPMCRQDDFWEAQWKKVTYIDELQQKYDCPVLHAGDLFHHWKPSPYLISEAIKKIPDKFYTVYGNHDLPYHRMENFEKSGVFTLYRADVVDTQFGCHYGMKVKTAIGFSIRYVPSGEALRGRKRALVWHKFVWKKDKPFPGVSGTDEAYNILDRDDLEGFDLIVTGDNHQSFTVRRDDKLLVNPGPITRQTVKDPVPVVYLYNADEHLAEPHELPHDTDAVSSEHREQLLEEERTLSAFVERLDKDWKIELSFESNIKQFIESNDVPDDITKLVYTCLEK